MAYRLAPQAEADLEDIAFHIFLETENIEIGDRVIQSIADNGDGQSTAARDAGVDVGDAGCAAMCGACVLQPAESDPRHARLRWRRRAPLPGFLHERRASGAAAGRYFRLLLIGYFEGF
jgi:hypothetical protein